MLETILYTFLYAINPSLTLSLAYVTMGKLASSRAKCSYFQKYLSKYMQLSIFYLN